MARLATATDRVPRLIVFERSEQQVVVFVEHPDDWSGKSDPRERRRVQSRLSQRRRRERTAAQCSDIRHASPSPPDRPLQQAHSSTSNSSRIVPERATCTLPKSNALDLPAPTCASSLTMWQMFDAVSGIITIQAHERISAVSACIAITLDTNAFASLLEDWMSHNCCMKLPTADRLLVCVKLNVFRALLSNSTTLGFPTLANMDDDAMSPFYATSVLDSAWQSLPATLRPTSAQIALPHHPWIDLVPVPRMRDNLLRAGAAADDLELCGDLIGMFSGSTLDASMIVWGEPWRPSDWEVSEAFVRKWGWMLDGCWELFAATNRWRGIRGERPLRFDLLSIDGDGAG